MKRSISIIILCLITSFSSFAAPNPKGMVIRDTDTMYVTFIIPVTGPNYEMLQEGVRYYDSLKNECRINPNDAKEFRFEHKGKLIRMVSLTIKPLFDSDSSTRKFRHLIIDGPIKLFNYYSPNLYAGPMNSGGAGYTNSHNYSGSSGTGNKSKNYSFQKGNGDLINYDNMNFKKDIPVFFENCPELVNLIEEKVYLKKDIEEMVMYYNTNCGSN